MKQSILAVISGLLCAFSHVAQAEPTAAKNLHLFLLIGQSNMAGRGVIDSSNNSAHPRVSVLAKDNSWKPAVDPLHYDKAAAAAGLGKPFAEAIATQNPKISIGLIPAACGGSPISVWAPGMAFNQTNSRPYDDAIARARRASQDGTLKAILWHQGESDCTAELAPAYEAKLRELITRIRMDLKAPELPFIIGQLGQFGAWNAPTQQVDQAQRNVAKSMPLVYFVPSDQLTSGDGIHFNTASLRTLGERFAAAYQSRGEVKK